MGDIAGKDGFGSGWRGQFGQLRDQTIPPVEAAAFDYPTNTFDPWISGAWTSVEWEQVVIMASNFEQGEKTPSEFVDESLTVMNYIQSNNPGARKIVYHHWPDPATIGLTVFNTNQMSAPEWAIYKNNMTDTLGNYDFSGNGSYYDWHVAYQDEFISRGFTQVKMVPVGPIIGDLLLTRPYLSSLQFEDLFVDDPPHGNENIYFLAGLICYMAFWQRSPSGTYVPAVSTPALRTEITSNLADIITYIRSRLNFYNAVGINVY